MRSRVRMYLHSTYEDMTHSANEARILSKLVAKPVAEATFHSSKNSSITLPSPIRAIHATRTKMLSLPSAAFHWILVPPLRLCETSPFSGKSAFTFPGRADPSLLGDSGPITNHSHSPQPFVPWTTGHYLAGWCPPS